MHCYIIAIVQHTMLLDVLHHIIHGGKRQADIRIGRAVIDRDASGLTVLQRRAGEHHVRHKSGGLVGLFRRQQVVAQRYSTLLGSLMSRIAAPMEYTKPLQVVATPW